MSIGQCDRCIGGKFFCIEITHLNSIGGLGRSHAFLSSFICVSFVVFVHSTNITYVVFSQNEKITVACCVSMCQ